MSSPELPWPVRCVVFDLDGLLVDTEPVFEEAARRLLALRSLPYKQAVLQAMMGSPARRALGIFREHYNLADTLEELAAETSRHFYEVLGDRPAPLMAGVYELLDRLENRAIPKAIATSSRRPYVQRILAPHGILHRFQFVLTAEDVVEGKPHPEIYEKAAGRFGHAAREMVVLEDSPNGLRAAKGAGARCVIVPHASVPLHDLAGVDLIAPRLDAPQLLMALGL